MKTTIIILLCYCCAGDCARILAVFLYPAYSHQSVYQSVWNELANRGHDVTVFTPNPLRNRSLTNLREIDISFMYDMRNVNYDVAALEGTDSGKAFMTTHFRQVGILSEKVYQHPEMQTLLLKANNRSFDVLIFDTLYPSMLPVSVKFQVPFVGIASMDLSEPAQKDVGNYFNPVVYPNAFFPMSANLSFWNRLESLYFSLWFRLHYDNHIYSMCDELARKYLGDNVTPVRELLGMVSMYFVNTNPVFMRPRPYIPSIVQISGLHIKPAKPLPQDLKEYLDEASNGVIYFSLGSHIKSHLLSMKMKLTFLETIRELPYKVLWKLEEANFTSLPGNLRIEKWLPQQDVLAHPNIKAFITQGGIQSLDEAIRNRVPLIGIPFFYDQFKNMRRMAELGFGQVIDKSTLTKKILKKAIMEVAGNQKYHRKVAVAAGILEDELVKPLDKVVWGIEQVIKYNGCPHLRSPLLDVPYYQQLFLDVIAFCVVVFIIGLLIVYHATKLILRYLIRLCNARLEKLHKVE